MSSTTTDPVWERIRKEVAAHAGEEPILASFLHATILNHTRLELALSFHIASQLERDCWATRDAEDQAVGGLLHPGLEDLLHRVCLDLARINRPHLH